MTVHSPCSNSLSKQIAIRLSSGEQVPHFAELDAGDGVSVAVVDRICVVQSVWARADTWHQASSASSFFLRLSALKLSSSSYPPSSPSSIVLVTVFFLSSSLLQLSAEHALMLWPAQRLDDNTQYIVALRALRNVFGHPVEPSALFHTLRSACTRSTWEIFMKHAIQENTAKKKFAMLLVDVSATLKRLFMKAICTSTYMQSNVLHVMWAVLLSKWALLLVLQVRISEVIFEKSLRSVESWETHLLGLFLSWRSGQKVWLCQCIPFVFGTKAGWCMCCVSTKLAKKEHSACHLVLEKPEKNIISHTLWTTAYSLAQGGRDWLLRLHQLARRRSKYVADKVFSNFPQKVCTSN